MYTVKARTLTYQTKRRLQFITITSDIVKFVKESGVEIGTITLQTHHTTCGLWVNEDEKNLVGSSDDLGYEPDLKRILDRFADPSEDYNHNDICDIGNPDGKRNTHLCEPDKNGVIKECINGHSHAHNLMIKSFLTLIIQDGAPLLGQWQEIMLIELDHGRARKLSMLAQGDKSKLAYSPRSCRGVESVVA